MEKTSGMCDKISQYYTDLAIDITGNLPYVLRVLVLQDFVFCERNELKYD